MAILAIINADKGEAAQPTRTGFTDGSDIAIPPIVGILGSVGGTIAPVTAPSIAAASTGRPLRGFADLFYFRVWPLPRVVDAQNPEIGADIPFKLWNAFLTPNTLNTIDELNTEGLTIDITIGTVFEALELKTVNAQIGEDAPLQISGIFDFGFDFGEAELQFLATLADILPIVPETPIIEKLEWLTDLLRNYDGSEQRIALRGRPRRTLSVNLKIINEDQRRELLNKFIKTTNLDMYIPAWQYQSRLKVATAIGDNKLYTNVARADLREGERVLILSRSGDYFLYTIEEVFADYVTITTAFSQEIPAGGIVAGAFAGRYPNKPGLGMQAIAGQSNLAMLIGESRDQVAFPDDAYELPTFNGLPLCDRRALAAGEANEAFDGGITVIDNQVGRPRYYSAWAYPFIEGKRQFLIQRVFVPAEMEFWRNLLDYCRGQQKPFYLPTYREDLVWDDETDFLVSKVIVNGSEYASLWFEGEPYRQIQIESSAGTFLAKISNVENNGTSSTLNFAEPIDADLTGAVISRISFLMLVRLGTDTVTITHNHTHSIIDIDIRAVSHAGV